MGNVVSMTSSAKGFDFDGVISGAYAACIASLPAPNNKNFVGRYISHTSTEASPDLTSAEAIGLTENGLAILVVQHCYKPVSFTDYATQGTTDANTAISHLNAMGAPAGMFVYCDIENFPNANAASSPYWAGFYGPQNILNLITLGTFHGLWESTGEGALTGANISQAGQSTPSCGTITVDDDSMVTSLGGFWGY